MQFHHLDATFGKLSHCELTLSEGLNIIEAPNESGKSTILAFLRAMLYGLPTRERGAMADKNRYAPWSLAPMQGSLSLSCRMGELTLRRDTARATAPMGRFSATYAGSGETVDGLTASTCGEQLLGIPAEVYERSAFIRQSSLTVDQNAELERRIAALISSGDDGISCTQATAALKKQLNARRYNKSGRIPALESEISALERSLDELSRLAAQKREAESTLAALDAEKDELSTLLRAHDLCDAQERLQTAERAKETALRAEAEVTQFRRLLAESGTPSRETLVQARTSLDALHTLQAETETARQRCAEAEAAYSAFCAAPKPAFLPAMCCTILFVIVSLVLLLVKPFSGAALYSSALLSFVAAAASLVFSIHAVGRSRSHQPARVALENALLEARSTLTAQERLCAGAEQDLLSLLALGDLARAESCIRDGFSRWDTFDSLAAAAQTARIRCEALPLPDSIPSPTESVTRPPQSRAVLQASLATCDANARDAQRTIDYTDGRCRAIGDALALESALSEKRDALSRLQAEYNAIALAMETLLHANTALQNRFSPDLSRRAGAFFSRLTGGKYSSVLLDRTFSAQTGESGSAAAHDALFLSLGALDQLYLAVRLAICDTVLPADDPIPLVLDDALVRFDDARCRAALELLYEESRKRQILLFTCQHREAAFLSGREGVTLLTL